MYRQSLSIRLHRARRAGGRAIRHQRLRDRRRRCRKGYIYVLRSESDDPSQTQHLPTSTRSASHADPLRNGSRTAAKSPTYLMAPVKVVATYRVYNVRASALENLLHRVFADAPTYDPNRRERPRLRPLRMVRRTTQDHRPGDHADHVRRDCSLPLQRCRTPPHRFI